MRKFFLIASIFTLLVGCVGVQPVLASDLIMTCDSAGCSGLGTPLFNEFNILPGDRITKTVLIVNTRSKDIRVKIYAGKRSKTDDLFLDVIRMSVVHGGHVFSDTLLRAFLDGRRIDIGTLGAGLSTEVKFEALFSPDAGNLYQRKKAVFDIFINAEGDDMFPTPTPSLPPRPPIPPILGCTSGFPCLPSITRILKLPKLPPIFGSGIIDFLRKLMH